MSTPNAETIAAWDRGFSVSDDQLDEMYLFLNGLLSGSRALGDRYALATMAFQAEVLRAEHMLMARRRQTATLATA